MTTMNRIFTGVGAHIAPGYADAVAVSSRGTQIFVSGTPGLEEDGTLPDDFTDEARQCWANVEDALGKAGAKLTDIVYWGSPEKVDTVSLLPWWHAACVHSR
ncbi:hypothetical protein H7J50_13535 [Mycobacterium intermedium]|uniref:Rid family hydrolase n=1 Tax=Mycobacterium intermedium TaxID=28445 RepID=UPI0009A1606A|nr:Rid family hydrolase [Mycobacterium intermedium]MCV6964820.1 hypothetical protein [Mycobacterium intermedium]